MTHISFTGIRKAQEAWGVASVSSRLAVLRACRHLIAAEAAGFADSVHLPHRRNSAETLPMEIVPLLDAIRFLERNTKRVLRSRSHGIVGRPAWLWGVRATVSRAPLGIVLVIGPFNYPLFLPGVQVLQALAAGNAVIVKPAPEHAAPMHMLAKSLKQAGLPDHLLTVSDTDIASVEQAFAEGIDKVILTGSAQAGCAVMHMAADHTVSSTMELSGNDAVLVHADCDIDLAINLLAYGLRLNGGATCIAPRRVFIAAAVFDQVADRLVALASRMLPAKVSSASMAQVSRLLEEARSTGVTVCGGVGSGNMLTPAIVISPPAGSGLMSADLFAPVMSLIRYEDVVHAIQAIASSRYCLSVSLFASRETAGRLAPRIKAGTVLVNDLIVPTADPRLPFEASGSSGFGSTRGSDGLLAMTRAVSLICNTSRFRPHANHPVVTGDASFFMAYIAMAYGRCDGGLGKRIAMFVAEALRMQRGKPR